MIRINLEQHNEELRNKRPDEIIEWAFALSDKRIVTTSFGIYSAVLLSTFNRMDKDINVIWCDTGFNTPETYQHANHLIKKFNLNISMYVPENGKENKMNQMEIPTIGDPKFDEFTEFVKLEPFRRALSEHQPELWFTNIRVRQTEYRNTLDILSLSKEGILKVSPFYYWSDNELDGFLIENGLPKNKTYFDPTKVLINRECGIHLQ